MPGDLRAISPPNLPLKATEAFAVTTTQLTISFCPFYFLKLCVRFNLKRMPHYHLCKSPLPSQLPRNPM
jgi:hypothetical protein